MTRASWAQQRKHVITELLDLAEDGALAKAFDRDGITCIHDVMNRTTEYLSGLKYINDNGELAEVPAANVNLLIILKDFANLRIDEDNHVTDWTTVTKEEFKEYRIDAVRINRERERATGVTAPTPQSVKEFDKSIKNDPEAFSVLKDNKNWDAWYTSFRRQAESQRLTNILNPDYKPTTVDEKELFKRQNQYMISVFDKKLQTDQAKETMRMHKNAEYQAQLVLRDIKKYGEESTTASIASSKIMEYLVSAKWGSPTTRWKGGATGYVRYWKEQCRCYEEMTGIDPFPDRTKITMLQSAVSTLPELNAIKTQDEHMRAVNKDYKLSFQAYYDLLISAAES